MPVADDSRSPIDTPSVARSDSEHRDAADHGRRRREPQHTLPLGDPAAEREQPHDGGGERQREPHVQQELAATLPTDGDGVVGTGTLGVTTVPGATLTPKLNAPAVA